MSHPWSCSGHGCTWVGAEAVEIRGTMRCPTCRSIAVFHPPTELNPDGVASAHAMMSDEAARALALNHLSARLTMGAWQSLVAVVVDETAKRPQDRVWTATLVADEHVVDVFSGMNTLADTLGKMPAARTAVLVAERDALADQLRKWVARAQRLEAEAAELRRTLSELAKGGVS